MMLLADVDPGPWASWAQVIALGLTIIGAVWAYDRKMQRRLDKQDNDIEGIKSTLAVQFGGNGGGIREAINRLSTEQAAQAARIDAHLTFHADHSNGPTRPTI
jgi:hypothetical protein